MHMFVGNVAKELSIPVSCQSFVSHTTSRKRVAWTVIRLCVYGARGRTSDISLSLKQGRLHHINDEANAPWKK